LAVQAPDAFIYPHNGGSPNNIVYGSGRIMIGDWRAGFLEVGAPLVFVTNFKLLDMVLEWVLIQNGIKATHQYKKKTQSFKQSSVVFPALIETRIWLRERLIALYEYLAPLRRTIIHDRHFTTTGGGLDVASSKRGNVGSVVSIASKDLRNLALIFVSVLRYLEGTWRMDPFQEKNVRRGLDELLHLHRAPSLGQLPSRILTVRVYVLDEDPIAIDLAKIRTDIATLLAGQDVVFDLRIVAVTRDGSKATAYMVGWDQIQGAGSTFQKSRADLATAAVDVPSGIDIAVAACDLNRLRPAIAPEKFFTPDA
jgi:hypothetical protein